MRAVLVLLMRYSESEGVVGSGRRLKIDVLSSKCVYYNHNRSGTVTKRGSTVPFEDGWLNGRVSASYVGLASSKQAEGSGFESQVVRDHLTIKYGG